jgi:diguanylate cyclase (GGDEF)-like protein/PAS domain S-box-containing protein
MKIPPLRLAGIVTGKDLFRVGSVCLYVTLLMHVVLAGYVRQLMFSDLSIVAVALLVTLFFGALARYVWPDIVPCRCGLLLVEQVAAVFIIVSLAHQHGMPAVPLPWLIGMAGVFPLALERRFALAATAVFAFIGSALDTALGMGPVDWLPQMFATLFVGLSASLLADTLKSNLHAIRQAHTNERRFDAIARATRHVFVILDPQYRIKYANHALQDIIGYTPEELGANPALPMRHPDDFGEYQRKLHYLRDTPNSSIFSRHRTRHKDGHWVWLETRGYNMRHDSAIDGLVVCVEDISARKDAELKLQEEHALLRAVLDLNPSMIYATDVNGRFTIGNLTFQRQFNCPSEDDVRGKTFHDILIPQAEAGRQHALSEIAERLHRQDLQVIESGEPIVDQQLQGLWDNDLSCWYRVNKFPLHDTDGKTVGMLCIARDISDRKEYEMRLEQQALHDTLTGLPNRRYLLKTIAESIANTEHASRQLAMLFCDLDFFKSVNDTHGHDFGDKCLMEITRRIQSELPSQDFIARFGGNEFVILTNASMEQAQAKADALLRTVSQQLLVDEAVVKIQTSIGIALLDPAHKNPSELIRDADAAMCQAKERGRNRAEIFDASLLSDTTKRAQMDVALRFALERDELVLMYQPKVSILNGTVKGFELLLRWNSPQYGAIPPAEFIPVAERSGLVVPIGLWVLEQACRQMRAWQDAYPQAAGCTIAVNVSMRQLLQSSFLQDVTTILDRTGITPSAIELELTETSAMANPAQTIENLTMLKKLGLRLALDDFGTGYSSLAHLQKLPVDVLKIDQTFVQGLNSDPGDAEIVRLILALAQTLNLDTVAEGVETRDDMIKLKNMGCYLAQGFAFSAALTADEAGELLRTSHQFAID